MNAKEFAKIAAAFAEDPASVQANENGRWITLNRRCVLYSSNEYRLTTTPPREWWVVLDRDGDLVSAPKNRAAAEEIADRRAGGCYAPYTVVHVAELLP